MITHEEIRVITIQTALISAQAESEAIRKLDSYYQRGGDVFVRSLILDKMITSLAMKLADAKCNLTTSRTN